MSMVEQDASQGITIARTREEIMTDMCTRIGGGESVSAICRDGGEYPALRTFWGWLAKDKDMLALYEAALQMRAHVFAEELLEIADDSSQDTYMTENGPRTDPEVAARSKLRVNTRQWIMSRLLPKKYGDSLKLDGDVSLTVVVEKISHEWQKKK